MVGILGAFSIVALVISILLSTINQSASAQFSDLDTKCVNLDVRPLYLSYNITQLESQSPADSDHTMMTLSLHENSTGRIVDDVSFSVTLNDTANETLISDLFYADGGVLRLDFVHGGNGSIQMLGTREAFLGALTADPGGNIMVVNFPFEEGGAFYAGITVYGIDNIRNICNKGEVQQVEFIFDGNGDDVVNIQVVPEFGPIMASVLLATMISAVIAYSRVRR